MARFVRFRSLHFPQSSKRFLFSSSLDVKTPHCVKQSCSFSAYIKEKSMYFLDCCKSLFNLYQIQAHLITSGLLQDSSFSGRLLKLSTILSDDLSFTVLIFKSIDYPDAFCVNTVIKSYSCSKHHRQAVLFYFDMLKSNTFSPNSFTFPPLFSSCAELSCVNLGEMCHGQALKFGVDKFLPVQNSLIHFYACCGLMDIAHQVLDEMLIRDLVTWNTTIDGYARCGKMDLAHELFDKMPERNVVSWNVMITGYLNFRNPGNALKVFREMMGRQFEVSDTTMVNAFAACGRSKRLKEGRSVHGFLFRVFPCSSLIIDTATIDMYSKCGRLDLAQIIFDRMQMKNLVSWNTMILGYCIYGNPVDGLCLYRKMVEKNRQKGASAGNLNKDVKKNEENSFLPDEITFVGVLCACARQGMLTEGRAFLSQMIDVFHLTPNFAHYWCMANLMANVGLHEEAIDTLRNFPNDGDVSPESSLWAELLGSSRLQGDVILGEKIAKDLIEQDPQNFSHYNLLVNVYAAAGKWEEVAKTKYMMKEKGIIRVPCSNLKDLKEIVHNVKISGNLQKI